MNEHLPLDPAAPLRGLRVLLVDDLPAACETLGLLLELEGAQVRTALCGAEALALAPRFMPQAVVLDLSLPDIGGLQLARLLRACPGLERSTLLALSGYSLGTAAWGEGERPFDACWVKPADTGDLVRYLAGIAAKAAVREN